jgi:tRNA threonylcarbamoyladenosine biosynthesis protein TsaE
VSVPRVASVNGRRRFDLPRVEDTRSLGRLLGHVLHAGDLVVLTGGLGAGKTTLTQGIAEGLGVRGPVTSPTFVIARVHPSTIGGPPLVHVDAYRLGGGLELDDLDLDTSVADSVTVVEWGHGLAEDLSEDRLEVVLDVDPATEARTATVCGVGGRWHAGTSGAPAAAGTPHASPAAGPRSPGPFDELGGEPC